MQGFRLLLIMLLTGMLCVEAGATWQLDQSYYHQNQPTSMQTPFTSDLRRAQTFVVGISGILSAIEFPAWTGGDGPHGDLNFAILGVDASGIPLPWDSGRLLEFRLTPQDIPVPPRPVIIDLTPWGGLAVTAGQKLAFCIQSASAPPPGSTAYGTAGSYRSPDYAGGEFFYAATSGSWTKHSEPHDIYFRTYVEAAGSPDTASIANCKVRSWSFVLVEDAVVVAPCGTAPGCAFVESSDRASGIKLMTSATLEVGQKVKFTGVVRERIMGEWEIGAVQILETISVDPLGPLFATSSSIGNDRTETLSYTGLCTVGLLVRTCGAVTAAIPSESTVYVDDGGHYRDGLGPAGNPFVGIRAHVPAGTPLPTKGTYIAVTGVSRVGAYILTDWGEVNDNWYPTGTQLYVPEVWARCQADVQEL